MQDCNVIAPKPSKGLVINAEEADGEQQASSSRSNGGSYNDLDIGEFQDIRDLN